MKRLILYLIRRRLHVGKRRPFRFDNQKSKMDFYYFSKDALMKWDSINMTTIKAHVSLNWLLDDDCRVLTGEEGGFMV